MQALLTRKWSWERHTRSAVCGSYSGRPAASRADCSQASIDIFVG